MLNFKLIACDLIRMEAIQNAKSLPYTVYLKIINIQIKQHPLPCEHCLIVTWMSMENINNMLPYSWIELFCYSDGRLDYDLTDMTDVFLNDCI